MLDAAASFSFWSRFGPPPPTRTIFTMDSHAFLSSTTLGKTLSPRQEPERLRAVLDIGSNSVLLLVAGLSEEGKLRVIRDISRVTRLSEGAAQSGELKSAAIDRTLAALHELRGVATELGVSPHAVATAGVRMAQNKDAFLLPAAEVLGSQVELLSGEREAELSYQSVAVDHAGEDPIRVIDIGGGSTELVVGQGSKILNAYSHEIGAVRLTERFVHSDPVDPDALEAMERAIAESFSKQKLEPQPVLYGLAGTVTSAAALVLGLQEYDRDRVDGTHVTFEELLRLRDELAAMTQAERRALPVLGKGRADVVVAGVTVLCAAMRHCGAQVLAVRDRGLRYALAAQES